MENIELKYLKNIVDSAFNGDNNDLEMSLISMLKILKKTENNKNKNYIEDINEILKKHQSGLVKKNKNFTRNFNAYDYEEESEFYSYLNLNINLNSLFLNPTIVRKAEDIILSYKLKDKLKKSNLNYIQKIILSGKPGTGKTSIAVSIANELSLKCIHVNIASLFSSYLGDTAKQIENIFRKLEDKPAVIIFDEFDSIAINRTNQNENGEIRRIVNTVLTSLDNWDGEGMIFATTNDKSVLDNAIWRRFDEHIKVDLPNPSIIEKLWIHYCHHNFTKQELNVLSTISYGYSPAEIKIISHNAKRMKILRKENLFLNIIGDIEIKDRKDKILIAKLLHNDVYNISTREIAKILKVSKSTIQRYIAEE